ncbi:MAG: FG-GAP repeat protein, partial [Sulfurovaceae bacterium]
MMSPILCFAGPGFIEHKVAPNNRISGNGFGCSLSAMHNYFVVGANYDDNNDGIYSGAAYIFERSGNSWVETAKLLADDR